MSQVKFNPESIQRMVAWMVFCARAVCSSCCQIQLERRWLERECESGFESE